jgi:hypothetical protein
MLPLLLLLLLASVAAGFFPNETQWVRRGTELLIINLSADEVPVGVFASQARTTNL